MPLYEYECKVCGTIHEIMSTIVDRDKESDCDSCNTEGSLSRMVGNKGGFRLKGRGWASDGYSDCLGDTATFKKANPGVK